MTIELTSMTTTPLETAVEKAHVLANGDHRLGVTKCDVYYGDGELIVNLDLITGDRIADQQTELIFAGQLIEALYPLAGRSVNSEYNGSLRLKVADRIINTPVDLA